MDIEQVFLGGPLDGLRQTKVEVTPIVWAQPDSGILIHRYVLIARNTEYAFYRWAGPSINLEALTATPQ